MAQRKSIPHLDRGARRRIQRLSDHTQDKVTFRRCQMVLRAANGEQPAMIAAGLDCSSSLVRRTLGAFRRRHEAALHHGKSPGRPRKLTAQQDRQLDRAASQSPRKLGKNFSKWTAQALGEHLKLAADPTTILRHLWVMGWHWNRPVRRVKSPDPRYAAKRRYLRRLERQARHRQIHLYFTDEVDIALLPTISGQWMKVGQQVEIDTPGQNQTQYGFGAFNRVTGRFIWLVASHKNNVGFRQLLQKILEAHADDPTPIVVIADNYRIHKAKAVRQLLSQLRGRLRVWFLPTYSPRLNRIERLWRHFRENVTDDYYFKTMQRLLKAVDDFFKELARQPNTVLSVTGCA